MTALADPETALRRIVETADVFEAGGGTWLLAPAPPEMVDILAVVGAADEDHEPDDAPEDGDPGEPDYLYSRQPSPAPTSPRSGGALSSRG